MCGRAAICRNVGFYAERFDVQEVSEEAHHFKPSGNISCGTNLPIMVANGDKRSFQLFHWGISWQSKDGTSISTINSRSETVQEKFPKSLNQKRCILICDGYFEWKKINDKIKEPYFFYHENSSMIMAAIYDESKTSNSKCFSLLTVKAGNNISFIHDRQPFLLTNATINTWLHGSSSEIDELLSVGMRETNDMLVGVKFHAVTEKVNNSHYQGDDCMKMKKSTAIPISNFFKISPKKQTVAISSPSASITSYDKDGRTHVDIQHELDNVKIIPQDIFYPLIGIEDEASIEGTTNEVVSRTANTTLSACDHIPDFLGDLNLYHCKVCDVYTDRVNERTPISNNSANNSTPAKVTTTSDCKNNSSPTKANNKKTPVKSNDSTPVKSKRRKSNNSPLASSKITSFFTKNETV